MHALIVITHPLPQSLSHSVATKIAAGISHSDPNHSVEIADLAAEGFDPRFTADDIAVHLKQVSPPIDIAFEQARIDRADALVLIYPVYWWSMPALLKGWIDRVFTNGWAYDEGSDGKSVKKLQYLQVHLVAIGGADMRTYARHGYFGAMKTQIDHGIFNYCGASVISSELLLPSESQDLTAHLDTAHALGRKIFTVSNELHRISA